MSSSSTPRTRPPRSLGDAGKRLWKSVTDPFELDDHDLETLRVAALAADRLERAQAILDDEGLVIENRFGQSVPHPATKIAHDAGQAILSAFRALNLPAADDSPSEPGRRGRPGSRN